MSFGGFLGMGKSYRPLPWRVLNYDTRQCGLVLDLEPQPARESAELHGEQRAELVRPDLRQPDRRVLRRAGLLGHDLIVSQNGFGHPSGSPVIA
jgi:hypothetical protein